MDANVAAALSVVVLGLAQLSPSLPPRFREAGAATAEPAGGREAAGTVRVASPARSSLAGDPVVFIVVDGVRWQEIFLGSDTRLAANAEPTEHALRAPLPARELTPHLHRLAFDGGAALGAPGRSSIRASGPRFVSLPAYREIFSGMSSLDCLDNDCPPIERPTLVDEVRDHGGRAAVFASWEPIARAAASRLDDVVVSTGRGPADAGVDPYPGDGSFRPDQLTAQRALEHLESARPDFLFLGLGEPDEYAHRGDYAGYVASLRAADAVVGRLAATLARMGERGARTHVLVATDHGRASTFREHGGSYPESAAVWMAAWGPTVRARGTLVTASVHHLADLAPTARTILGLPAAASTTNAGVALTPLLDLGPSSPR